MSEYETVAVPFVTIGNRRALTDKQLMEQPWLREFVMRFRNCFVRDEALQLYWFEPDMVPVHGR